MAARLGSFAIPIHRPRESVAHEGAPSSVATGGDMNSAQRLLMANQNAAMNIADLWVAVTINTDNDSPFESDDEHEKDEHEIDAEEQLETNALDEDDTFETSSAARHNRFSRCVNTNVTFNTTHWPSIIMASVRPPRSASRLTPRTSCRPVRIRDRALHLLARRRAHSAYGSRSAAAARIGGGGGGYVGRTRAHRGEPAGVARG
ncbi:hypothetical protein TRAPUB_1756 [Trametes pubescens]|uniref:Uncharacterized protein n=1 Tax=Trametes pubescens TaxID=154538 RepID=A0A1M2VII8_TRAPU|nr:hypothetical protein TRAPUB_1756 [Trametes pubescens]